MHTAFVFFFFLVNLRLATRLFGIDFLLLLFGGAVEAVRVELGLEAEHALAQLQVHVRQPLVLGLEVRDRLLLVGELLHVQRLRQTDLLVGLAQLVLQRRDKLRTFRPAVFVLRLLLLVAPATRPRRALLQCSTGLPCVLLGLRLEFADTARSIGVGSLVFPGNRLVVPLLLLRQA